MFRRTSLLIICFVSLLSFKTQAQTTHWWNDAVFYEVFVRSFSDSDGDGKGDIKGLIEKLDYLNDGDSTTNTDLGITGLWLMPIQQSPSYHGYDVEDYLNVESDYGTNEDFKLLMEECHKRGIKVIVDFVMNHTSNLNWWFLYSNSDSSSSNSFRDWYIWEDNNPGWTQPWGSGSTWHSKKYGYYYGIFWQGMPDLNYANPEVKDTMFNIGAYWLDSMGVDGFRLDAVKYIYENGNGQQEDQAETYQFWRDYRTFTKNVNPNALSVGEAWTSTDKVAKYSEGDGLDICFEFDLAYSIISCAKFGNTQSLRVQMDEVVAAYPHLQYATFLTNHDQNRIMNELSNDHQKAKTAAQILLTLPGVPFLYYGEEIGMNGVKPDEDIRKPMQWTNDNQAGFTSGTPWRAINNDYTSKNVEQYQYDETSLWNTYQKYIHLRNNQVALRLGDYKQLATTAGNGALTFQRHYGTEKVIVAGNVKTTDLSNVDFTIDQTDYTTGAYKLVNLINGTSQDVTIDQNGGGLSISIGAVPANTLYAFKLISDNEVTQSVFMNVDMKAMIKAGDFSPQSEKVQLLATFNGFGADSIIELLDDDNDSVYTIETSLDLGYAFEYKYRIGSTNDGREEFANSGFLRKYTVYEGVNSVLDVYQNQDTVQTNTSIQNIQSIECEIYPNPTSEFVNVQVHEAQIGVFTYKLYALGGQLVKYGDLDQKTNNLIVPLYGIESGEYVLSIMIDNQNIKNQKILIK